MNRRSFFQLVTGFAGGVFAAFASNKTKAESAITEVVMLDPSIIDNFDLEKIKRDMQATEIYGIPPGWTANEWTEAHNNTVADINEMFDI